MKITKPVGTDHLHGTVKILSNGIRVERWGLVMNGRRPGKSIP